MKFEEYVKESLEDNLFEAGEFLPGLLGAASIISGKDSSSMAGDDFFTYVWKSIKNKFKSDPDKKIIKKLLDNKELRQLAKEYTSNKNRKIKLSTSKAFSDKAKDILGDKDRKEVLRIMRKLDSERKPGE